MRGSRSSLVALTQIMYRRGDPAFLRSSLCSCIALPTTGEWFRTDASCVLGQGKLWLSLGSMSNFSTVISSTLILSGGHEQALHAVLTLYLFGLLAALNCDHLCCVGSGTLLHVAWPASSSPLLQPFPCIPPWVAHSFSEMWR